MWWHRGVAVTGSRDEMRGLKRNQRLGVDMVMF